jgi:hypothetical protein
LASKENAATNGQKKQSSSIKGISKPGTSSKKPNSQGKTVKFSNEDVISETHQESIT